MESAELRWISESDREALDTISKDSKYQWHHSPEYFEEILRFRRALVAFDSGTPVGYLLYQVIWGNTPFLSQIWLKDDYQGQGLGKKMVVLLEERLRAEGYKSLTTSNEKKNADGVAFCKKLGFQEIGLLEMAHGPEVFSIKQL